MEHAGWNVRTMNIFDLSGRIAIVTGGNTGIGFGIAQGLAGAGAGIVVSGRNRDKNAKAVQALRDAGAQAMSVETDIRKERSCRDLVAKAADHFGRIDILVNNAGIAIRKQPQEYSAEDWHNVIDTNLSGAFHCAQAVYPHMQKAEGGKIINIGSMMSLFGASFAVAYAASKGGIVQMTKALACAWAKDNVQVNAILPGWIDTEFTQTARAQVPGLNERVLARTPAGRWGNPTDFAGVAVFLASGASDFVNGATITVDGAYSSQI